MFICCLKSIKKFIGEEKLKIFINFCLKYIADLDIPVKRYMFIVCLIILSTLILVSIAIINNKYVSKLSIHCNIESKHLAL